MGYYRVCPLGRTLPRRPNPCPHPSPRPPCLRWLALRWRKKPTRPLVLALDGRCGSGKTTLANALAAQLPGYTLLRTDDFYLPPARRSPDWARTPCANMDLTRLRDEALRPAYAGQTVNYRAYSAGRGLFCPRHSCPRSRW